MKKMYTMAAIAAASLAAAQDYSGRVGINTTTPNATIDITSKTTDGSKVEGAKLPTQSKAALAALEANGKTPVEGTIVYVDDASSGTGTTVSNVFEKGYYIFQDGTWKKMVVSSASAAKKSYTCSSANIGQVLQSTHGTFTCINDPIGQTLWKYDGIELMLSSDDPNASELSNIHSYNYLDTRDFSDDQLGGFGNVSTINGQFVMVYGQSGFSSIIPDQGVINFFYFPFSACARIQNDTSIGWVTKVFNDYSATCSQNERTLVGVSRIIDYRINN